MSELFLNQLFAFYPKRWSRSVENMLIDHRVVTDNALKWSSHLEYISGKNAKDIVVIIKGRKILSPATLLSLYNFFIMPYLSSSIHVWGKAYVTH